MTEYDMNMAAQRRPLDYHERPPQSQWNIDAGLCILDWNGLDLPAAEKCIAQGDENEAEIKFKMSLDQLIIVVDGWHKRFAAQKA